MPLTKHIRLPVTDEEFAEIARRAGGTMTGYLRKVLGLPPRKAGRPVPPKPRPKP